MLEIGISSNVKILFQSWNVINRGIFDMSEKSTDVVEAGKVQPSPNKFSSSVSR
jgi:hypothetical protein